MDEIELKVLLDPAGERRLRRVAGQIGVPAGRARTRRLETTYFDTPDGRLGQAGIALRLRRAGGRWEQTVKCGRRMDGGLSRATEATAPVPAGRIDLGAIGEPALRARIEDILGGEAPVPVYGSEIRRTDRVFRMADGSAVELAIDVGRLAAGARTAELTEAELELVSGDPRAVFELARLLFAKGGLRFSRLSKAARARMLRDEGRIFAPAGPRKARAVALAPDETAAEALRAMLAECLEQVSVNADCVAASDDPEGPHQLRIGLRRTRAALRLFRHLSDNNDEISTRLSDEARWLGAEVSRLRDLDVARIDLVEPDATTHGTDPGFAALIAALAAAAAKERARLRATLRGHRAQRFLIDLTEFVALDLGRPGWGEVAMRAFAPPRLAAQLKKVERRARGLKTLPIPERHELRKALKMLRYKVEFLGPLYERQAVGRFLRQLRKLQDVFGDLNDAAMAEALFTAPGAPGADDPAAMRAAGRVIGMRDARAEAAWADVVARWERLEATPRFWE